MKQQEFFGEIELINNKNFEGKFTINELGEFKHIQSECMFREEHILLKREFTEAEKEYYEEGDIVIRIIFILLILCLLIFIIILVLF